jgi:ribosomal protein S27AE
MSRNSKCPNCGSSEFITEPNQYDILEFSKNGFETITTEVVDDSKIFCRECGKEVDILKSSKKIILK